MAWTIAVMPMSIIATNVIKYILEAILCSIILALARRTQNLVIQDRLPNRFVTSRRLWERGWHLSGRRVTIAFIFLFILLHGSFLVFEFAFDSKTVPLTVMVPTESPKRKFRLGDKPLDYRYREATQWCSYDNAEGITLYFRPRRLRARRNYSYSQIKIIDGYGFTCPGERRSSVAVNEEPLKIDIMYADGKAGLSLKEEARLTPSEQRYFKQFDRTLVVGGIDLRIVKLIFDSFEKETPNSDRDVFISFYRYHVAKYIWAGLQRTEELIIDDFAPATSISWAVIALAVHLILVIFISLLVFRASPIRNIPREELPINMALPNSDSSSGNSDTPLQRPVISSPIRTANVEYVNTGNRGTHDLGFHTWRPAP